ncbi:NUDIX hydrolase domain-containing protein [Rhizobium phaseoli]|uniref:NUDIX hydrolase n=2 Tax=Rhizobium TaxID=379 RepID=A0A192TEN9_9HYPH|nr:MULTISPECIES: NUDIX hydrolase [Rhizobium]ACE93132.1 putative hydrolase MutT/nudix family protein [Rhizobium etli CIAT 652]MDH6648919.1 8-oxo-dGTP diphosphatase [Rhizobium esperanzae]ANL29899.1 NUDIX hydrolase domain-containing protein [Rhizobium phaseoli]ANL42518.1 NUDIX hydrolase domain-containing protein [Rhizobium phaseoli]ANL55196.1 NUDIX hydrolase domain-containing protein [Rhizobium phaseoli]
MAEAEFARPIVTVDIVLLTLHEGKLCVALLQRPAEPFAGVPALIGGYVHTDEDPDAEAVARRILRSKAGLEGIFFEQLRTFASARRDPRDWSVSIAYFALVPRGALEGSASLLELRPVEAAGKLPFDHNEIVDAALERLRGKGAYSTIPARLLPAVFTMSELQAVYETVMGERLDPSAFRRKINDLDLLEVVEGEKRQTERARRPTTLYRLKTPIAVFDRRL